ncbi:MAG: hypothetical protein WCO89_13070, partial [Syntrophus sp. (in: bacteria)]
KIYDLDFHGREIGVFREQGAQEGGNYLIDVAFDDRQLIQLAAVDGRKFQIVNVRQDQLSHVAKHFFFQFRLVLLSTLQENLEGGVCIFKIP